MARKGIYMIRDGKRDGIGVGYRKPLMSARNAIIALLWPHEACWSGWVRAHCSWARVIQFVSMRYVRGDRVVRAGPHHVRAEINFVVIARQRGGKWGGVRRPIVDCQPLRRSCHDTPVGLGIFGMYVDAAMGDKIKRVD